MAQTKIVNIETGEEIEREINAEESADIVRRDELMQTIYLYQENKAIAKAALLAKLGITDDEAKLLLS